MKDHQIVGVSNHLRCIETLMKLGGKVQPKLRISDLSARRPKLPLTCVSLPNRFQLRATDQRLFDHTCGSCCGGHFRYHTTRNSLPLSVSAYRHSIRSHRSDAGIRRHLFGFSKATFNTRDRGFKNHEVINRRRLPHPNVLLLPLAQACRDHLR